MDRRTFLASCTVPFVPASLSGCRARALAVASELEQQPGTAQEIARDEDFWFQVQEAFEVDRSMVNFNNGGVSPSPASVQRALARHNAFANEAPAYKMWQVLEPQKESVRERLARQFGASPEETAIVRNASEGLQICQQGFDLRPGDEVLCTTQDYPRMVTTFHQRERREGIVLRQFKIPTPLNDPAEVVRLYESNITEKTRLILVCHMINLTGQILPVREVVALGRARGIPVIVDGAHSFAHFAFDLSDLDCDYFATSLHKWLFAPFGTGMLYVRREKIHDLWPLMAAEEEQTDDIRKFEQFGTHPVPIFLAIADAITFHEAIGIERKEARLVHLRDRWIEPLKRHDRLRLNTNVAPRMAAGIANVGIKGVDTAALQAWLWNEHRIYTIGIVHETPWGEPEIDGLRVSPSVYSTLQEVDRFVAAMEQVLEKGLPS